MTATITEAAEPARPAKSRSEEVAETLRDDILSGQYRPGERLPSERDLANRFSTSRGVVREAFKMLEQLGVASIQPGGARAVALEECTLDVLAPLLDLQAIPDPKLADEVLQIIGVLMSVAVRRVIDRASDEELDQACQYVEDVNIYVDDRARSQQAFQNLMRLFIDVADHLVLRLIINGLRITFMTKMMEKGIQPNVNPNKVSRIAKGLRRGLKARDGDRVSEAMLELNQLFRDSTANALLDLGQQ